MRDKILSIDRRDIEMKLTYISTKTERAFLFTRGTDARSFITFMDCCLRIRVCNVVRNVVDYLEGID